jgi:hypothetical protein
MTDPARFSVRRLPGGGISLGWSGYSLWRECPRKFVWAYVANLTPSGRRLSDALLYGLLWHAMYRGRLLGRSDEESVREVLAEEPWAREWEPEIWQLVREDLTPDLDWYEEQERRGVGEIAVLWCERELAVPVGRHEMRCTPDLVGAITVPGGRHVEAVVVDHKTVDPRMILDSRTYVRYREARQLTFQLAVWNEAARLGLVAGPETRDAVVNLVPRRPSKAVSPRPPKTIWALRGDHQLARIKADFVQACEEIERLLDVKEAKGLAAAEAMAPENPNACVVWSPCPYLPLCEAAPDDLDAIASLLYGPRILTDGEVV